MPWWLRLWSHAVLVRHDRLANHTFGHGSLPGRSVTILQLHKTLVRAVCLIRIHRIAACVLRGQNWTLQKTSLFALYDLSRDSWCWTKATTVSGLWAGVSSSYFWTALDIKKTAIKRYSKDWKFLCSNPVDIIPNASQISIHLPHESMITSIQVLNQLLEALAPEMKASCLFRRLSSLTSEKIISGHLGVCKVTSLSEDMSASHAETFSRLSNTHALLSLLRSLPPLCFPVFLSGFNHFLSRLGSVEEGNCGAVACLVICAVWSLRDIHRTGTLQPRVTTMWQSRIQRLQAK